MCESRLIFILGGRPHETENFYRRACARPLVLRSSGARRRDAALCRRRGHRRNARRFVRSGSGSRKKRCTGRRRPGGRLRHTVFQSDKRTRNTGERRSPHSSSAKRNAGGSAPARTKRADYRRIYRKAARRAGRRQRDAELHNAYSGRDAERRQNGAANGVPRRYARRNSGSKAKVRGKSSSL